MGFQVDFDEVVVISIPKVVGDAGPGDVKFAHLDRSRGVSRGQGFDIFEKKL